MQVKIARAHWLRGSGNELGYFCDPGTQRYCVLGHVLKALGATDADLVGKGSVTELSTDLQEKLELATGLLPGDTVTCHVTDLNDDDNIADDAREERLICELGPRGVDLVFFDGDPT